MLFVHYYNLMVCVVYWVGKWQSRGSTGMFGNLMAIYHIMLQFIQNHSRFVMPPPLGAGGIMFSGCPSVRPSEAWNTLFWPVHGSVGPPDQPLPFYGMSVRPSVRLSVRPSGEVSGHLPENAWRDKPEILHADVSWPSSELISLWSWSVGFSYFGSILT